MSAAGYRRGEQVELSSVNGAEGRSQYDAYGPHKLAEEMARANMDDDMSEPPPLESPVKDYEQKYVQDQAEAQADADAAVDAAMHAHLDVMQGMNNAQLNAYVEAELQKFQSQSAMSPAPSSDEKQRVNNILAQAGYTNQFQTLTAAPGKRKAVALGGVSRDFRIKQVGTTSKQNVEAEIRALEEANGCDLSEKNILAEQEKETTLNKRTIPRLLLTLEINFERKVEIGRAHV